MKKLFEDMVQREKTALITMINAAVRVNKPWKYTFHAKSRMTEKNISVAEVMAVFDDFTIIELNVVNGQPRILIRGTTAIRGKNTCLVVNPIDKVIVTCYKNSADDHHATLRREMYH